MPYFLNATLVRQGRHRFSAEPLRAEGENVPHASIPYRSQGKELRPEQPAASGAGLLPLPSLAYYTPDQLSKRPQPLAKAELDPPDLNPIVASGKVVLQLWIDAGGKVTRIEIESNNLPPKFVSTALRAFEQLRFVPGEREGRAVGTVLKIEVAYEDGRLLSDDERGPPVDGRSRAR
jgi:TonB family protein